MDLLNQVLLGFSIVLSPINLLYCFAGVVIGTLIGVLPGIGPSATLSLLLPFTLKASPVASLIMLAGIYYGAQYGGSTTSILVNIPGEAASVVTCLDGYQMARKGRAGAALGMSAFGSFIGGTLSVVGLMLFTPVLASLAFKFGPPELFCSMCCGLTMVAYLTSGSLLRALMMASLGVILGCFGQDPETGTPRFAFGVPDLMDGIGLVPFVMGLFGISEVLSNIEKSISEKEIFETKVKGLLPNLQDWKNSIKPIFRGSFLGFFAGIIPGGGPTISSFISYAVEKKFSKHPEKFGTGAIEGVAGPETANNAATGGSFIPLFALGIPPNVPMALLLGSLIMHGVIPGPLFMQKNPDIYWGVITSMYVGNVMLLILNLPLIAIWVQLLKVPYKILFPLILLLCCIGAYTVNNSTFDLYVMLLFGVAGYLMRKYDFQGAPLILGYILGPMLEISLRQSLLISHGKFSIFVTSPIACGAIIFALFVIISALFPVFKKRREAITKEDDEI
jgi:putative tricarboxylic transport membrane protein